MRMRGKLEPALRPGSPWLWLAWAAVPLFCVLVPGLGALAAFIWICAWLWLGAQPLSTLGLNRPQGRTVGQALVLAAALYGFAEFGLDPWCEQLTGTQIDLSSFANLEGNGPAFAENLAMSWAVGAVLEEVVFRGFFIAYGIRLLGAGATWPLALLGSVLFGFSHLYQGPAGMLSTGVLGFGLAAIYILSRRNLALAMLTHGLLDSIYYGLAFTGLRALYP